MKIEIKKISGHQCQYTLTRADQRMERITLETKTYLVHDICHYVVEKNLKYTKGFWGMLSAGYHFKELFGKDNKQTAALRLIEQIVGPVQSTYSGHIPKAHFEQSIRHTDFSMPESVLNACLAEIRMILSDWEQLPAGQQLMLEWTL